MLSDNIKESLLIFLVTIMASWLCGKKGKGGPYLLERVPKPFQKKGRDVRNWFRDNPGEGRVDME